MTFNVDLAKEEGVSLGAALKNVEGRVVIVAISASGILHRWNEQNPSNQIHPGDKVVAVNGCEGAYWDTVPKLWQVGKMLLTIQRDLGKDYQVCRTPSRVYLA